MSCLTLFYGVIFTIIYLKNSWIAIDMKNNAVPRANKNPCPKAGVFGFKIGY
jgi:hypothetical protein